MSASVLTRSFSNIREGANLNETVLTALHVQKNGVSHLFDCVLADDARGTEGMPLVVNSLTMEDGLQRNVLFTATMANDVYAIDADTGEELWKQHVGNPIIGTKAMDEWEINTNWGILSTPVINLATGTLYAVSISSPDGLFADNVYQLHSLNLINGADQAPPLVLNEATYQPPGDLPEFTLGSVVRKQRPGLLLDSFNDVDTVFIGFGSFLESASTNQGWVVACDVTTLAEPAIAASWTTTARYPGGGLWMGAQGLALDENGYIYGMTGNGAFDPPTDFGECIFKLQYDPKDGETPASLTCVDWIALYTDTGRVGGDPTVADISLLPAGSVRKVEGPTNKTNAANMNSASDEDFGSGGPLPLPASRTGYTKNAILGAGKDGIAYIADADNLGQTALADFAPDKIAGNYAKLLSPPYGFTYYPAGIDLSPVDLSTLPTVYPVGPNGFTHHQHSTPVYYKSPRFGPMIFTGGENGPVRASKFNADFTLTYLGCGAEIASSACAGRPPGGMPGTMMTLSANDDVEDTAVLWCLQPLGNANTEITPGRIVAYGADWIDNGRLVKIWDSWDWPDIRFMFNKFNLPVCTNGKLYVPTYDARIMVFG